MARQILTDDDVLLEGRFRVACLSSPTGATSPKARARTRSPTRIPPKSGFADLYDLASQIVPEYAAVFAFFSAARVCKVFLAEGILYAPLEQAAGHLGYHVCVIDSNRADPDELQGRAHVGLVTGQGRDFELPDAISHEHGC